MSKKLPIYFSDNAWESLQDLMGSEGKPSPTINTVLEQIAFQTELVDKLGLYLFYLEQNFRYQFHLNVSQLALHLVRRMNKTRRSISMNF